MKFHGIRFIPDDTKIPFMRLVALRVLPVRRPVRRRSCFCFSRSTSTTASTSRAARSSRSRPRRPPTSASCAGKIDGLGLGDAELQEFGGPSDVLIRLEAQAGGEQAQNEAVRKVQPGARARGRISAASRWSVRRYRAELTQQGIIAVVFAIMLVLIYIWFRFEWQFSIGAVVSLLHDVILTDRRAVGAAHRVQSAISSRRS